jgi:hypothetical protein
MKSFVAAAVMAGSALAGMTTDPEVLTTRPPSSTYEPSISAIMAAQATIMPEAPTSDVKGVAFNRFFNLWLENVDANVCSCRQKDGPEQLNPHSFV